MLQVERWDESKKGPFSEEALRQDLESRGYRVSRYSYPPGTVFPDHSHDVDKIDAIVAGRFEMETSEGKVILGRGDALIVPRGTVHNARVLGNEVVVSLDATRIS